MIKTKRIAFGAAFTALILLFQLASSFFGSQLLTGSLVNMVLAVSALRLDFRSTACVCMISPAIAFMLGIGPKIPLFIPFIMAANIVFALCIYYAEDCDLKGLLKQEYSRLILWGFAGAVFKCLMLFLSFRAIIPFFIALNDRQSSAAGAMFSMTAFAACLAGFALALILRKFIPSLRKG